MALSAVRTSRREPSLSVKLAFLGQPGAYPEGAQSVETVETHWSYVFLTHR